LLSDHDEVFLWTMLPTEGELERLLGLEARIQAKVKAASGLLTRAVGLIVDPQQAEDIIARGDADQVALARAMLDNPRWPWHAAERLGATIERPPQYARTAPAVWPGATLARAALHSP